MSSSRKPAMVFVLVTLFLDILGIGLIIPILPMLVIKLKGGDLESAARSVGLLASLYGLMQFVFAPVLGALSDRFGRRKVILISLFGGGLDYLLLAFAPNLAWFYVGRMLSGLTGANITAATAYIADVSPPEKRAANFGMIGAAFGLGFVLGPALGGLLGAEDLRLPFIVAAGLTLLNWLYGYFVLPESLEISKRRPFSWKRANPVGSLFALSRYPMVLRLAGVVFLIQMAHMMLQSTWALYTGYRYAWGASDVGWSLAFVGLMAAVVQGGLARKIIPRFGEKATLVGGLVLHTMAFAAYGLATRGWMLYPALFLGCMAGVAGPAGQGLISRGVPDTEQGVTQGAVASLGSLAGILSPIIATNLFGFFISERAPVHIPGIAFFVGGGIFFLALVLAVGSFRHLGVAERPDATKKTA